MGNRLTTKLAALLADLTAPNMRVADIGEMFANDTQFQFGSVTGTGAGLDQSTDGDPRFVIIVNANDGTFGVKTATMGTTYGLKGNATGPALSYAAQICTLDTNKFTIGTDAQLNTAHVLHWMALI